LIEIRGVTKQFGDTLAADDVSFMADSGAVTAFLGPNGAGKTTTLRVLLGLTGSDRGEALIDGRHFAQLRSPRETVGAVIDGMGYHPARTGRAHLKAVARAARLQRERVDDVLELVELSSVADRRVGGYSQGMRQRLALAGALLGDPPSLVLDEPANGLDPAGIAWLRSLLLDWAAQGRTVLLSSHVLADVQLVADRVVIIDRGRVVRDEIASDLTRTSDAVVVRVRDVDRLRQIAARERWTLQPEGGERFVIHGPTSTEVGAVAVRARLVLSELRAASEPSRLEDLFLEVTSPGRQGAR
jgi:ABC-2 type transport system ATP-binding protein